MPRAMKAGKQPEKQTTNYDKRIANRVKRSVRAMEHVLKGEWK